MCSVSTMGIAVILAAGGAARGQTVAASGSDAADGVEFESPAAVFGRVSVFPRWSRGEGGTG